MNDIIKDKTILVTGGTGSIGSELVKQLLQHKPKRIRVFSRDETKQFHLRNSICESDMPTGKDILRFLIGDVRDRARLVKAAEDVDIIFHIAALKHVASCEFNADEAIATNVRGTQNVIHAALVNNVKLLINVSTDKATNPCNVMGATKLLAERLIMGVANYKGSSLLIASSVRFGNVLNSRGSVIPLWKQQLAEGKNITVTNPDMTRFFMTPKQAAQLIIEAASMTKGEDTFILKMPAFALGTLADLFAPREHQIIIGPKPGEKSYETLMTKEEAVNAVETDKMFIIINKDMYYRWKAKPHIYQGTKKIGGTYDSRTTPLLHKEQLRRFLKEENLL